MQYIPVKSTTGKPLMPCHPARFRELRRKGKAVKRFHRGQVYCQLTERQDGATQQVVVGIDPGSKKEGFSVVSEHHDFLHIQADAVTWVKEKVETRRTMRRARRFRKTPCRQNKMNRLHGKPRLPPSTKARWQWKLRVCWWLYTLYPITAFVVENVQASTKKGTKQWNHSFSPLEVGKAWFYEQLFKLGRVETKQGYETAELREQYGLTKSKKKMADIWEAHCIDSWCLAMQWFEGKHTPEQKHLLCLTPLRFIRRQLHKLQPAKGGVRKREGGTMSLGIKRGTQVLHPRYGLTYVGGHMNGRLSLHSVETGKRLTQAAKPDDCTVYGWSSWRQKTCPRAEAPRLLGGTS